MGRSKCGLATRLAVLSWHLKRVAARSPVPPRRVLLQVSPINGFQYYDGEKMLPRLRAGQRLSLRREPRNPHDERAVAVYRRNRKLGYLPRAENTAVAYLMDSGERLESVVAEVMPENYPWNAVRVKVDLLPD
ncbi:MAG: HIRAN domain-containing protein [Gammaproteobacteria bacterium]|nr:HIRAN domain-containing protein [Gammaproteobacteria bacterium]MDE0479426.1 HIRAN domain-containing protein [Gammaproteobacteria bacterium]MDE0507137.1 HIRAN domain-containing protein [Gammaproteobacteria bacterium]